MKQTMSKRNALLFLGFNLVFSMFVIGVALILLLSFIGFDDLTTGLLSAQLSILIFAFILYGSKKNLLDSFSFKISMKDIMFLTLSIFFIFLSNTLLSMIPIDNSAMEEYTSNTSGAMADSGKLLMIFIFPVIIAPILEELAFRGGFKRILIDKANFKPWHYVVISGVVFGAFHYQPGIPTIVPVLLTGTIGAIHAILYLKTKNILFPILSHMIYNFIIMSLVLWSN